MSSGFESGGNYDRWNSEWIEPYARGRVLDIGRGIGNHLAYFTGERHFAVCRSSRRAKLVCEQSPCCAPGSLVAHHQRSDSEIRPALHTRSETPGGQTTNADR